MYAFLIVVTIILPNKEKNVFRRWSAGQYEHSACTKRANEVAQVIARYAGRRIRFGRIMTEASCDIRPTRPI